MTEAISPAVPLPGDGGLEERAEVERPWSLVARHGAGAADDGETPSGAARPRVIVEYVVVDGEDAEVLRERQAMAIRVVVEWVFHHSTTAGREA